MVQVHLRDIGTGWPYANDDRRAVLARYAARQGRLLHLGHGGRQS